MVNLNYIQDKEKLLIAFDSLKDEFVPVYPLFSEWLKNTMNDYLTGSRVLLGIEYSKTTVGYVLIHYFDQSAKLNAIYVFPKFRKKGIAEEACKVMFGNLKQKKIQILFTQIRPEYPNARKLFKKLGFFQIGTIFNSDEQNNNDLYCISLDNFLSVEFIKKSALSIYTKYNIEWK